MSTTLFPSVMHQEGVFKDKFVYIIEGKVSLITDAGTQTLTTGVMAGVPAGEANGHHLVNESNAQVVYLEVGDRTSEDEVMYPDDDLLAKAGPDGWIITRKDGSPYE